MWYEERKKNARVAIKPISFYFFFSFRWTNLIHAVALIKPILLSSTSISHHWFKQLSMTSDCYMNIFILIKIHTSKTLTFFSAVFISLSIRCFSASFIFGYRKHFNSRSVYVLLRMCCRWENVLINKIINLNIKNLNVKWWNCLKRCEIFCPEIWGFFLFFLTNLIMNKSIFFFLTLENSL